MFNGIDDHDIPQKKPAELMAILDKQDEDFKNLIGEVCKGATSAMIKMEKKFNQEFLRLFAGSPPTTQSDHARSDGSTDGA